MSDINSSLIINVQVMVTPLTKLPAEYNDGDRLFHNIDPLKYDDCLVEHTND